MAHFGPHPLFLIYPLHILYLSLFAGAPHGALTVQLWHGQIVIQYKYKYKSMVK